MAVTFVAVGSWVRIVTSGGTVAIPGSPAAGDRMLLVGTWKDYSITVTTPTGWTSLGKFADGTVAAGNGTGSVAVQAFYRDYVAGDGAPAITYSSTPTEAHWVILVFRKGASENWTTPTVATAAIALATTWTATASSAVAVPDGSAVVCVVGFRDDSATMTRPTDAIRDSAGVVTWNGNYVEAPATHFSSTTGLDMSGDAGYRLVSAGAASVTLVASGTLSASETGAAYWVVLGAGVGASGSGSMTLTVSLDAAGQKDAVGQATSSIVANLDAGPGTKGAEASASLPLAASFDAAATSARSNSAGDLAVISSLAASGRKEASDATTLSISTELAATATTSRSEGALMALGPIVLDATSVPGHEGDGTLAFAASLSAAGTTSRTGSGLIGLSTTMGASGSGDNPVSHASRVHWEALLLKER